MTFWVRLSTGCPNRVHRVSAAKARLLRALRALPLSSTPFVFEQLRKKIFVSPKSLGCNWRSVVERLCLFPQDPYFQSEHIRFKVVNVRLPSPCIRVECTFPCLKAASVPLSTSFTWTPASHQTYKVTEALYLKCAYILCASFLWLVISRSSHHVWRWGLP